jgi:hypothetical protein
MQEETKKVFMKKFLVSLELTQEVKLTVWARDETDARKAFKDPDISFFDYCDEKDITSRVYEVKDKLVTPEGGIVRNGTLFDRETSWKENGEEFEPTDDIFLAQPEGLQATLQAERDGSMPLPGFETLHEVMEIPIPKVLT